MLYGAKGQITNATDRTTGDSRTAISLTATTSPITLTHQIIRQNPIQL